MWHIKCTLKKLLCEENHNLRININGEYKRENRDWERHKDFHLIGYYDLCQEYIALICYIFIIGGVYNILDNYNLFREVLFIRED